MIPQYLFKYTPINKLTIENLINNQLYFNNPASFNDPFDCSIFEYKFSDKLILSRINQLENTEITDIKTIPLEKIEHMSSSIHRATKKLEDYHLKDLGCSCFSESHENILMWSHYSNNHMGICIKFNTLAKLFDDVYKVKYSNNFPKIDLDKWRINEDINEYINLVRTKSIDWEYEQEHRIINTHPNKLLKYDSDSIEEIYFGIKTSNEDIKLIQHILKHTNIKFYKASKDTSQYKIKFENI